MIEERAAGVFGADHVQRPAGGVHHQPLLVLARVDLPDFLDADAVVLHIGFAIQVETLDQLLADVSAAALGEQGVLGAQFHARRIQAFLGVALAVHAQIARDDAAHHTGVVEQRFLGGEAWIDFHAEVFGLLRQPAAQVAQRDDVVALVVHGLGHEQVGHLDRAARVFEHIDVVAFDFGVQRRAEGFPVGEQLIQRTGFEHRAREDVGAHFRAFLDHADADLVTGFGGLLLEAAGTTSNSMYSRSTGFLLLKARRVCFVLWVSRMPAHGGGSGSRARGGLHRIVLAAHYIYTTWRVQYKRLFEYAAAQ